MISLSPHVPRSSLLLPFHTILSLLTAFETVYDGFSKVASVGLELVFDSADGNAGLHSKPGTW